MRQSSCSKHALQSLFQKRKVVTLNALKNALETGADMTVFRYLKQLTYHTSYSHRGKYYTLAEIPEFDEFGLWSYRSIRFSKHGNLLQTCQHFVENAEAGLNVSELQKRLRVDVQGPLLKLFRTNHVTREKFDGVFVYMASDKGLRTLQLLQRKNREVTSKLGDASLSSNLSPDLKTSIHLFYSLLDEQQRRLFAGLESQKLGRGGDRIVADFLNMDAHTVARGRVELAEKRVDRHRTRNKGGGRVKIEKKRPKSCQSSEIL